MKINIPLDIDEKKLNDILNKRYENRIFEELVSQIKASLAGRAKRRYGTDLVMDGMTCLISESIGRFLETHSEKIIEIASSKLADRLARSKKGKAILDGLEEQDA